MKIFKKKTKFDSQFDSNPKKALDPRVLGELRFLQEKMKTYDYLIEQCRNRERELDELIKEQKMYNKKCKKAMSEVLS